MLFGLYVLCYFLAADDDAQGKVESFEVLNFLKEADAVADSMFEALSVT
jgi:hypothetical protein